MSHDTHTSALIEISQEARRASSTKNPDLDSLIEAKRYFLDLASELDHP